MNMGATLTVSFSDEELVAQFQQIGAASSAKGQAVTCPF